MNALPGRMSLHVKVDGDCLTWTGAVQSRGYGSTTNGRGGSMLAHRRAWIAVNGDIPDGMTIDHRCRNKLCVNVAHMEVVSRAENIIRGAMSVTHCARGHELAGQNLIIHRRENGQWQRECRTCASARRRANYAKKRKALATT